MENPNIPVSSRGVTPERNRAYDTRRDDDIFVTPSITIYDIDYAILYHIQNKIAPQVLENGNKISVPVIIANGETWSQIQSYGFLRDKDDKLMTPIILLKRNSLAPDDRVPKLDIPIDSRASTLIYFPDTQHNNKNDWINKTQNTKKSQEYMVSVIPEHVKVSYELYIWTDLTSQMNSIVEEIIPQDRLPWGDVFQFTTKLSDYSFESINSLGEDRLIRTQIPLEVTGILQSEFELKESTVRKAYTTKRVDFMNEQSQTEIYVDHLPRIIRPSESRRPSKKFN